MIDRPKTIFQRLISSLVFTDLFRVFEQQKECSYKEFKDI